MGTEQIFKLQPDRTLYLRGFTGVGAAAALYNASPTGFSVSGVFRDMADFCVLNVYDADNTFEHYSVRYLPDFDLSGMILTFDVSYRGLQPLDSAKYSWIDWASLDAIREDGTTGQIRLWEHAQLISGNYSVASGSCTFTTASGGCSIGDSLTLVVNNVSFKFEAQTSGLSADDVANFFKTAINRYDWSNFDTHSVSVLAEASAGGVLTLKNARAGHIFAAGSNVQFVDGILFSGIAAGSTIYIGGKAATVAAVTGPKSLALTSAAAIGFVSSHYLAEYGGLDGNEVTAYILPRPGNASLAVDKNTIALAGGNSDDVVWRVSLDFSGILDSSGRKFDNLRQAWLTFAPQLANGTVYRDTEWTATFSNWTVTDPQGVRKLQCAGPGSVRVDSEDSVNCVYGEQWKLESANNLVYGFARSTQTPGNTVTLTYTQNFTNDLYLGTSLSPASFPVSVSLDGDSPTKLDCWLQLEPGTSLITRRLLRKDVPAGKHTVTLTVLTPGIGDPARDPSSCLFLFDYLEAAVAADFADSPITYENASPALDWDTDATYKVSPSRLMWHLQKLRFRGQLNEYFGVFWWNQRKRGGSYQWSSATVTFSNQFAAGDTATLRIGAIDNPDPTKSIAGFVMQKAVTELDTPDSIAAHFVYYINSASVSMWAERSGPGALTIHTRTPNWGDTLDQGAGKDPRVTITGNVQQGVDGTWIIDTAATNPVNFPFRQWHADLFTQVKNANLLITGGFSMELVNPPDDGEAGNEWYARYANGDPVTTDTGFSSLSSSHCAPVPNLTNYQIAAYKVMAGLQADAGLTPWLQFGEFLWWFFSLVVTQQVGYCAYTNPISIGVAQKHKFKTGDRVVIAGVEGCPAANGTWQVTVTDDTHFTIPTPADGAWTIGSGTVTWSSMAYYDAVTKAAALAAIGRPLAMFGSQDEDPTINNGADVQFLAGQLKAHVDEIRTGVLVDYPQAKFELLFPNDVNNKTCYLGKQGGRLNAAVNLPAGWMQKEGSGLDRFKVEALSWSTDYNNLALAEEAITFASKAPMGWAHEDTAYLVPWFRGVCPWPAEYHLAKDFVPLVNFWAYDHLALMSWPLPFPTHGRRATYLG